jgi:hypothetical protein
MPSKVEVGPGDIRPQTLVYLEWVLHGSLLSAWFCWMEPGW